MIGHFHQLLPAPAVAVSRLFVAVKEGLGGQNRRSNTPGTTSITPTAAESMLTLLSGYRCIRLFVITIMSLLLIMMIMAILIISRAQYFNMFYAFAGDYRPEGILLSGCAFESACVHA